MFTFVFVSLARDKQNGTVCKIVMWNEILRARNSVLCTYTLCVAGSF